MGRESGAGVDAVSCEGTAALSMAARMLAAGRWLLTWWLCAVVGGVRHHWMRPLRQVSGVLCIEGHIQRRSHRNQMQRRCHIESGCS